MIFVDPKLNFFIGSENCTFSVFATTQNWPIRQVEPQILTFQATFLTAPVGFFYVSGLSNQDLGFIKQNINFYIDGLFLSAFKVYSPE